MEKQSMPLAKCSMCRQKVPIDQIVGVGIARYCKICAKKLRSNR